MTASGASLPRHILLATDLSARCDRAQDRALELAREWQAKLTMAHVLDVPSLPDDEEVKPDAGDARGRALGLMHRELKDIGDVSWEVEVREGRPSDVVLDVAREKGCDLIVTGIAGRDTLGRFLLGSTSLDVVQHAEAPVLVVKSRCHAPYRGAVVASDLSPASGSALEEATRLFRPSQLTLFHAFDMPYRAFAEERRDYEDASGRMALDEMRSFLTSRLGPAGGEVGVHVAYGDPATLLAEYAAKLDIDLVVGGTNGRTGILGVLLGSVAAAILDEVPCDVLIVPSKGARQAA
ncbi:universal stress protein [Chelatococcus reniformis]|uniref:Universal stress protein n=1 Tax=Chelatococcus reniformis TaxID=1494448 RepID=A0A916UT01_9HYPH|nr:universal stress protein [Chelatococcus reniformis]GGC86945.1 universal stress protein [Chelatococcus reniformis]